MKKKILFIDRDGTLVIEPPVDYQLDSLEKLEFYPKVFRNLGFIRSKLDFEFVMVTNQDGLGTDSFPEETFWPAHNLMLKTLAGEGITFDEILIDRSFPEDNAPTRKPRTGMPASIICFNSSLSRRSSPVNPTIMSFSQMEMVRTIGLSFKKARAFSI